MSPTEDTRRLTKEKFDALTIPYFVIKKGTRHGALCGKTEAQREYRQAKDSSKKAIKNNYSSIVHRFQQQDTHPGSQQAIVWDEDICRRLDKIASEDNSYIATWCERQRDENHWKLAINAQGRNCLLKVRTDYDKKMIKRPILQLYPAIKLVNDHFGEVNGDGIHGPHRLRLRQNGNGRKRGGLPISGRTIIFYKSFASWVHRTSHVSHTHTFSRVWHKAQGLKVAAFCCLSRKNHPHRRISCRTLHARGLIAHLFHCRPALRLCTPSSEQEYPLQSATRSSVWSCGRTELAHSDLPHVTKIRLPLTTTCSESALRMGTLTVNHACFFFT